MALKKRLSKRIDDKGFLIVSHRGEWGGNILQNTTQAAALASRLGADVVEIDVCRASDGEYYLFHGGNEKALLQEERKLSEIPSKEIDQMPVYNSIQSESGYHLNRLEDFLDWLSEGLYLNIDRAYFYFDDSKLFSILRNSGKADQFFLKSPLKQEYLMHFVKNGKGLNFIPIITKRSDFTMCQPYLKKIQTIGYEIVFKTEEELAEYQEKLSEIIEKTNL